MLMIIIVIITIVAYIYYILKHVDFGNKIACNAQFPQLTNKDYILQ